jgi:hypothetical protein
VRIMKNSIYASALSVAAALFHLNIALAQPVSEFDLPTLAAKLLKKEARPDEDEKAEISRKILSRIDQDQELTEALVAAQLLFGDGMRREDGKFLVGLSEEIAKRVELKVEKLPRNNKNLQKAAFAKGLEYVRTMGNLGAHKEIVQFYERLIAPYESLYKAQPGFGTLIGFVLGSYYATGGSTHAQELADRMLSEKAIKPSEKAAIAVGQANNLLSAGKLADAMALYNRAISLAPQEQIVALAYYWISLNTLTQGGNSDQALQAASIASQGLIALKTPLLSWEIELQERLTALSNDPLQLSGRNAEDLALLK